MLKSYFKAGLAMLAGAGMLVAVSGAAMAYSCEGEFAKAEELIKQAEAMVKTDTDSRILGLIAEAKGIAAAGIISHRRAGLRHVHKVGKFMHSDAVRKGRWAQNLAKQALFLLDGKTR